MTGYIRQLAARRSLLQTRKVHGQHFRQSHASVLQERLLAPLSRRSPVRCNALCFDSRTDTYEGPFELTKLSAQISVLMAERNDGSKQNDAIRKSYQNLGTLKTAQNLVRHRGWTGLYSGFHLHLRKQFGHL